MSKKIVSTKPFYKSKEVWIGTALVIFNVLKALGIETVEIDQGVSEIVNGVTVVLLIAIRLFSTQGKLTIK